MFEQMRSALGISKTTDILDYCYSLSDGDKEDALHKIREIERSAMIAQVPQPGLAALMEYLEGKKVPKAICTRNFDAPVNHLLEKFLPNVTFTPVITRDFKPPKPHPAGILHIAKSWGFVRNEFGKEIIDTSGMIMVGYGILYYSFLVLADFITSRDSLDDLTAGYRAGAATVLLVNDLNIHLISHEYCGLAIERLDQLIAILDCGLSVKTREERDDTRLL